MIEDRKKGSRDSEKTAFLLTELTTIGAFSKEMKDITRARDETPSDIAVL